MVAADYTIDNGATAALDVVLWVPKRFRSIDHVTVVSTIDQVRYACLCGDAGKLDNGDSIARYRSRPGAANVAPLQTPLPLPLSTTGDCISIVC
ncbi:hypothetical protein H257_10166 [Aphanomyces astaci]|uniref:Uncharacterized protein n=1 Tax=Aphanomyces astaci TaxID=112090 RepID=W4G7Z7_APHAT|nr:hypothetical protein H257_10166 [Aphanomyces astaci]ETV75800.1 hypothetical protein H257_10166 [Aphanomyces astaci]|eukprot:XP_009834931.1 hypothetical protein H257_10166 [Aphanomyces astaci]